MTAGFDELPTTDSLLSRLDSRWKLASLAAAALVTAVLTTLPIALLAFACALFLAVLGRLPVGWYLARMGGLAVVLLFFVLLLPFLLHDDGPSWRLGPLVFSWFGLRSALLLCVKALTIVTLMLVLFATAPLSATLKAAHALHVPGLFIQVAMLTYRYVFVLFAELGRLRIALRVRGYRNRATRHSYRTVGHVAGILLVRGVERAERVSQAMRCRGFDGRFRSLARFQTSATDVLFLVCVVAGSGALWFWDHLRS